MQKSKSLPLIATSLRLDAVQVLPAEFNERIAKCRRTRQSNCIGTALFITGEQKLDVGIDVNVAYRVYLKWLRRANRPTVGCLAAWVMNFGSVKSIAHLAVVTSIDPVLVTHRKSTNGKFVEDESIEHAGRVYRHYNASGFTWFERYYLPTSLNNIRKSRRI